MPDYPMIRCNQDGGKRPGAVKYIIIHGTVSPTECGGARDVANYLHDLPSPEQDPINGRWASCHYIVDPCETVQTLPEDVIAWGAPPLNEEGLHIELCDPQVGDPARWSDAEHQQMLDRAAILGADVAARWGVPLLWQYPTELLAGEYGFTDHENVSLAWGQTSHTDPGWSMQRSDAFMAKVSDPPVLGGGGAPTGGGSGSDGGCGDGTGSDGGSGSTVGPFPLEPGNYFGLITGPADSHGGWYAWEQPYIKAIQQELIRQGYVPGVTDPGSSWADGIYEWPTHEAVARFQNAEKPHSTTRPGEVWGDDWSQLFTGHWG